MRESTSEQRPPFDEWPRFELEVIPGLEEWAEREARVALGPDVHLLGRPVEGRVGLAYGGSPAQMDRLQSVVAVHKVLDFDVPRPKALLGHEHLTRLLSVLRHVIGLRPENSFNTLRVSAAGAGSEVFTRLTAELASALDLEPTDAQSHLLISVRRPPDRSSGWQVLVRLTPRPLSARSWRVCDFPGALNATVAHVMASLTDPSDGQRFVNFACGSGTLLVERLRLGPAALALGIDVSEEAVECARRNIEAAGYEGVVELVERDLAEVDLPDGSVDAVVGDLPYGMLSGADDDLAELYSAAVERAARVTVPAGRLVVITARRRLFERALADRESLWTPEREVSVKVPFKSGHLTPSIWVLSRNGDG